MSVLFADWWVLAGVGLMFFNRDMTNKFTRMNFDMVKMGFVAAGNLDWANVSDITTSAYRQYVLESTRRSEYTNSQKALEFGRLGRLSDRCRREGVSRSPSRVSFSIILLRNCVDAHARLCPRSSFFKAACSPGFVVSTCKTNLEMVLLTTTKEAASGVLRLSEDATTVETLLMEMYGVINGMTGSVFAAFALKYEIEKEFIITTLMKLFIAVDKVSPWHLPLSMGIKLTLHGTMSKI